METKGADLIRRAALVIKTLKWQKQFSVVSPWAGMVTIPNLLKFAELDLMDYRGSSYIACAEYTLNYPIFVSVIMDTWKRKLIKNLTKPLWYNHQCFQARSQ